MQIQFHGFRDIPRLHVDPKAIERVFVNLLMNAIKYGKEGTTIKVRAVYSYVNHDYRVTITNEGIGVEKEDMARIFELAFRADVAQKLRHGAGIGLYVARQLMVAHGGQLLMTSGDKEKTEFTVVFPNSLKFQGPDQ